MGAAQDNLRRAELVVRAEMTAMRAGAVDVVVDLHPVCAMLFASGSIGAGRAGLLGRDRRADADLVHRDILLSPDWLDACARAYADPSAWASPLVSPLCAAHAGLPPLLIQAGTDELLAPDAGRLAASASAAGVDVTYTQWPRLWHDFMLQPGLVAAADSALAQAAWFLTRVRPAA